MNVKVATYSRQSLDIQEGIDRQLRRTRAEADKRGWTVVREYKDNDTSANKPRGAKTDWARMIKDAESGQFTHVMSVDVDRLLRNQRDLLTLIDLGLKVVTIDGEIDLSTADGEMRATLGVMLARFETRRKSERQVRANADRTALGKPVPGRRRYGYEGDNMTLRPDEAARVQWAFDQIAAGKSIRSTAATLDMRAIRVREMLTNVSYKGMVKHLGNALPGKITPCVSVELWETVNAILKDPKRKTSPGSTVRYIASGIAVCGVCGAPLHFMRSYMCSAATNHVSILQKSLEDEIALEVFLWFASHDDAEVGAESEDLSALLSQAAELARSRTRVQEVALMDGADMAFIKTQLADIQRKSEALEASITAERGLLARSGILEAVRGDWWALRDERTYGAEEDEALEAWPEFWKTVPLDQQREIVRDLFTIKVMKGRALDRVKVTPR